MPKPSTHLPAGTVIADKYELAAALSRSPPESLVLSPDVTLLRRWVEAELE
jgi:hypothetical protein